VRQQVPGFSSTAGDPRLVEWGTGAQGPHQFTYSLSYRLLDAVTINWRGQVRSGAAYTPMVAGDINGDGYGNDRAFVYGGPAPGDSAVRAGMEQLLAGANDAVRECLGGQLGRVAARNSCRGPWSSTASLNLTLDRVKFRMPQRASISLSLSNPLGAADLLVNGSDNLRGWGATPSPDAALLYVRGFDPDTRRYQYEVNQRFGATRPQFMTLRSPVVLTLSARFDLGPTRERQLVEGWLEAGRTRPGSVRRDVRYWNDREQIPNAMWMILREQDTLQLTSLQADSLAAMNRRYNYQADSIWTPVARHMSELGMTYDFEDAFRRWMNARKAQVDLLIGLVPHVSALLTPEQRRRLSRYHVNALDPRYLRAIRNGTNSFVSDDSR
jgi:hypothetical protein